MIEICQSIFLDQLNEDWTFIQSYFDALEFNSTPLKDLSQLYKQTLLPALQANDNVPSTTTVDEATKKEKQALSRRTKLLISLEMSFRFGSEILPDSDRVKLIMEYIDQFGNTDVCFFDIKAYLDKLATAEKDQLLKEIEVLANDEIRCTDKMYTTAIKIKSFMRGCVSTFEKKSNRFEKIHSEDSVLIRAFELIEKNSFYEALALLEKEIPIYANNYELRLIALQLYKRLGK